MASGRSEKELQGVTMLGHKTDYPTDYAPQVLEAFDNKHPDNDYLLNLTVLSLLACALWQVSQILRQSTFLMYQIRNGRVQVFEIIPI